MERLQKIIAGAGLCSRRAAEDWIRAGRVTLNGHPVSLGETADPSVDRIAIDGKAITGAPELLYLVLNKPADAVTTRSDPQGRRTVMDLIPASEGPVYPVGRLDRDTEGLLILTNDGELTHRLNHPRFGVEKTYRAEVRGRLKHEELQTLREGVMLMDGVTSPAKARVCASSDAGDVVELTIHEGRKRQVRRMLKTVGHPVLRLTRIAYGPIRLARLKQGDYRRLSEKEVKALRDATQVGESCLP